jgi:hypothetical protein
MRCTKCDRCGAEIANAKIQKFRLFNRNLAALHVDLCDICYSELEVFLGKFFLGNRGNGGQ